MKKEFNFGCRKQNVFSSAKMIKHLSIACLFIFMYILILLSCSCKKDETVVGSSNQTSVPIIPNSDFENWTWEPLSENWGTNSCPLCTPPFETYIVQKDSQVVYHGKYSMKLIYNLTPTGGYAPAWAKNKFAISEHPSSLHGYVKCNVRGTDTVSISIKLLNKGISVDSGQWRSTISISNWTEINIPISYSTSAIDSALITITGGKYKDSTTNLTNSTTFWVDYFSLLK